MKRLPEQSVIGTGNLRLLGPGFRGRNRHKYKSL